MEMICLCELPQHNNRFRHYKDQICGLFCWGAMRMYIEWFSAHNFSTSITKFLTAPTNIGIFHHKSWYKKTHNNGILASAPHYCSERTCCDSVHVVLRKGTGLPKGSSEWLNRER